MDALERRPPGHPWTASQTAQTPVLHAHALMDALARRPTGHPWTAVTAQTPVLHAHALMDPLARRPLGHPLDSGDGANSRPACSCSHGCPCAQASRASMDGAVTAQTPVHMSMLSWMPLRAGL